MISEIAVNKKLFRNVNHAIWFFMSIWLLVITTAYYFYPSLYLIIFIPILVHLVALIEAIYTVNIKMEKSETLSKDCIWFNTLMVLIYLSFLFITYFAK